jgi:hypothetical protein
MVVRAIFGMAAAMAVTAAWAQEPNEQGSRNASPLWRPAAGQTPGESSLPPVSTIEEPSSRTARPEAGGAAERRLAAVGSAPSTLPNSGGQVWREYDISPYTLRVTTTQRPEQAVVDWILRETGYEAWHGEPLGVLSATPRTLRVYHTPDMQATVAGLVDRFVATEAETTAFGLRVVTVDNPNWRTKAQPLMRAVDVQTPGTRAWVMAREDATVLLSELRRRTDFREHSSPHLLVNNGQATMVSAMQTRHYAKDVVLKRDAWPGFEIETGRIDEGYTLEFSPLLSSDRRLIDAVVRCQIDQIEKMVPVVVDIPTAAAPRQRTKVEVPQMTHFRFEERFRWPVDQVLLVGMGMVALPLPVDAKAKTLLPGVPLPLPKTPPRADLLVFVEAKSRTGQLPHTPRTARRDTDSYRGRY